MININNITELGKEFEDVQLSFNSLHDDMQVYLDGYQHNFFYGARPNMAQNSRIGVNLVQVFADKLWHHTSEFPKINVPTLPDDPQNSELREKIVNATHQKNNTESMWADWTFDGAVMAVAVARTVFNIDKRCPEITRYDPRRCYWQKADSNNGEVEVFWTATPMTKSAIQRKYNITPKDGEGMVYDMISDNAEMPFNGQDYYLVMTRDDSETSAVWVGKTWITKPYKHLQGGIPVDVAMPYKIANYNNLPTFYLGKLKELQAEFNELWRRRANVVRKLGNPLVYGRGIYKQNEQDVKAQMASDGGFVSLKENGELALLTIPETAMIDNAIIDCFSRMKDVAGFPTATFGESVGANTSGDALGMYFTPTQKMINHYNKANKSFLQGINAKILRGYEQFGKIGEEFNLAGFMPHGSLRSTLDGNAAAYAKGGGYSLTFTKDVINGNYMTVVTPAAVTPKDDIAYKRFILDSVTNKFMSRQTGLDEIGILSPEDEFKRLQEEQSDPMLNPEGAKAVQQFDPMAQLQDPNGASPFPMPPQQPPMPQEQPDLASLIGG